LSSKNTDRGIKAPIIDHYPDSRAKVRESKLRQIGRKILSELFHYFAGGARPNFESKNKLEHTFGAPIGIDGDPRSETKTKRETTPWQLREGIAFPSEALLVNRFNILLPKKIFERKTTIF
jgi:hypothetical protein